MKQIYGYSLKRLESGTIGKLATRRLQSYSSCLCGIIVAYCMVERLRNAHNPGTPKLTKTPRKSAPM